MKAPTIPMRRSPIRPNPVPRTICPANQPAMRPTSRMTRTLSLDMYMFISFEWRPTTALLFAAKSVLEPANGILNFSSGLFGFAVGLKLGIARDFADDFFHGTFGLLRRSLDAVFVHLMI